MDKKAISKLTAICVTIVCAIFIFQSCTHGDTVQAEKNKNDVSTVKVGTLTSEIAYPAVIYQEVSEETMDEEFDVRLIALVTMAEAESESDEGKRLVIDTILNRVDSVYFPDTVYDVVYQPYQFSSMWDGRADCCEVREDICELVREEMNDRSNYDCIFFNSENYSDYGVPLFQVENHYFSSYE